jgi:protease-4
MGVPGPVPGAPGPGPMPPQMMMSPPPMMYPPPPGAYPPPMMFPPGMFKPQKSFARMILTTLAVTIFGISLTLNIYLLAFSALGFSRAPGINQTVVVEGDPHQKIAVIPVSGMILDSTAKKFNEMLTAAEKDANVKAVVIDVDTPGGAVTPSDEIHARIERFKSENPNRPVVVTMGGMATSGGYYVSCGAHYIYAQPTTLTGNIGVILPRYNFSKLAQSYGVEEVTVTAPANGFKNAGSPFAPINPDDNKYLQGIIEQAYGNFKTVVTNGRGNKLRGKIDDIANGKVYTAAEALKLGLVDNFGYATDAYNMAASLAKLSNKHVVQYNKPQTLFDLLAGGEASKSNLSAAATNNGQGGAGGVTINGVNVNVDSSLLQELSRPRLMYYWRGQ